MLTDPPSFIFRCWHRAAWICSHSSRAAEAGSSAWLMARETGRSRHEPSSFNPARTASSRSPPCAPTPGAKIHVSRPALILARRSASGSVAPTTRPSRGGSDCDAVEESWWDHSLPTRCAMRSYKVSSSPLLSLPSAPPDNRRASRSWLPGLEVLHSRKAPRPAYFPEVESAREYHFWSRTGARVT
jgi:hypothetical protein